MPTLRHDGVDLHYEIRGSGTPLLLVAGLAADGAYWMAVADALAAQRTLILLDNRGSGRSQPLDAPISVEAMADDCAALVRHLALARIDIVGHSLGGMIAQACAIRHPEVVDRMVLVATGPVASARNNALFASWSALFPVLARPLWFRNLFLWVFSPAFFAQRATVDALVQIASTYPYQQTPDALTNQIRALAAFDASGDVQKIRARTLLLAGTDDLLFPRLQAEAFARSLPNASFAAIEGAAHSIPIEFPDAFTARVLDFLRTG